MVVAMYDIMHGFGDGNYVFGFCLPFAGFRVGMLWVSQGFLRSWFIKVFNFKTFDDGQVWNNLELYIPETIT